MKRKIIAITIAFLMLLAMGLLTACPNKDNYKQGGSPHFFTAQHLILNVGQTAHLDINTIFTHSGIAITDFALTSTNAWVASVEKNKITALRAGNKSNGTLGYTQIWANLYERSTQTAYRALVAKVYVIDKPQMTPIKTTADLFSIADDLTGHYILMADIDLSGTEWTKSIQSFAGKFVNGGDYSIKNLSGSTSLFSDNQGFIFGINFENARIDRQDILETFNLAAVVDSRNQGVIAFVNATGSVQSSGVAGGLVGQNTGLILNSSFNGLVENKSLRTAEQVLAMENPYDVAGGIVGKNQGTVANSTAGGQVLSSFIAGGIAGINFGGSPFEAVVLDSSFVFLPDVSHRLIAPVFGNPIGWQRTLLNRV